MGKNFGKFRKDSVIKGKILSILGSSLIGLHVLKYILKDRVYFKSVISISINALS